MHITLHSNMYVHCPAGSMLAGGIGLGSKHMGNAEVFKDMKISVDIALTLLHKRDLEQSIGKSSNMSELKERRAVYGVKPKQRRKAELVSALIYEKGQGLRFLKSNKHISPMYYWYWLLGKDSIM